MSCRKNLSHKRFNVAFRGFLVSMDNADMNLHFLSIQLEQLYRFVMITKYKGQKLQYALLGRAKIILTTVKVNWLFLGYSGEGRNC